MMVVIPFHNGDLHLVPKLLRWIAELGDHNIYNCILVHPESIDIKPIKSLSDDIFASTSSIRVSKAFDNVPWPKGANIAFGITIEYIFRNRMGPFLWLEPDCVPLKTGWLDEIFDEYLKCGKPLLGTVNCSKKERHLSGVAVYPEYAYNFWREWLPNTRAFDMVNQEHIISRSYHTNLIQNFWGKMGLPPTFKENLEKTDPINTLTLSAIKKRTVLFHRCKDGSLIDLISKKDLVL